MNIIERFPEHKLVVSEEEENKEKEARTVLSKNSIEYIVKRRKTEERRQEIR
jgi:hypothetical protein